MQRVIVFHHEEVVDLLRPMVVAEVEAMTGVVKTDLVADVVVENGKILVIARHADRHTHLLLNEDISVYGKKRA